MINELTHLEERAVIKFLAQEFIEQRLGLKVSRAEIRRFAAHLIVFEKEMKPRTARRKTACFTYKKGKLT